MRIRNSRCAGVVQWAQMCSMNGFVVFEWIFFNMVNLHKLVWFSNLPILKRKKQQFFEHETTKWDFWFSRRLNKMIINMGWLGPGRQLTRSRTAIGTAPAHFCSAFLRWKERGSNYSNKDFQNSLTDAKWGVHWFSEVIHDLLCIFVSSRYSFLSKLPTLARKRPWTCS